ncbi:MAG: hypothetical protein NXI00_00960 [Cytophagales bacterium]|nr:hypothetical protein [Cytophagales bacterium]
MKKLVALLTLTFALSSCSDNSESASEKPAALKPIHTLIFMDKTSSVDVTDPFVAQKYQSLLKEIIDQNIRQSGDRLDIYFVHENTAKGKSLSLISRTEKDNLEGMNATDLEAAQTNYEFSLKKEQGIFLRQSIARLQQKNNGGSNKETNLSAAIPIISDAAENQSEIKAYFLSDMVESLNKGRDFHKSSPSSSSISESWANEDLSKFSDSNLTGTEVLLALPFEPTSSSKVNNPYVTEYWRILLEGLGASVQEI